MAAGIGNDRSHFLRLLNNTKTKIMFEFASTKLNRFTVEGLSTRDNSTAINGYQLIVTMTNGKTYSEGFETGELRNTRKTEVEGLIGNSTTASHVIANQGSASALHVALATWIVTNPTKEIVSFSGMVDSQNTDFSGIIIYK